MLTQASAFVIRSLRQESRLLLHHLARGGMVMFMVLLFCMQAVEMRLGGASGLSLIKSIKECWYWSLILVGASYFSAAIVEEKEEQTLPLLRMTGVGTVTLLLGKSLPRLMVVFLLILVAAPLLLFAQMFGGVLTGQIVGGLASFMAFAFCLNQAGLLAGTLGHTGQRAMSLTVVFWLLLEFGSGVLLLAAAAGNEWGWGSPASHDWLVAWGNWLWQQSLWSASGYWLLYENADQLWHSQIGFHLIVGTVLFLLSWLLFEPCTRAAHADDTSAKDRTFVSRWTTRQSPSRRAQMPALVWKSWRYIVGGWPWLLSVTVLLPVILVLVILVVGGLLGVRADVESYGLILFWVGLIGVFVMTCRAFGLVLSREVQHQTLTSLCMLPVDRKLLIRELLFGAVPAVCAPFLCMSLGFIVLQSAGTRFALDLAIAFGEPWTWAILGWAMETVFFGILLSLYVRHGAMLFAIAINWIAAPFIFGFCFMILSAGLVHFFGITGDGETFLRFLLPLGLSVGEVALMVWLFRRIVARVDELAAK